jgi:GxxExxY protein
MTELLLKEEVHAIIGAAIEVHKKFGPGFLEAVYHEAMEIEIESRGIPFESHKRLTILFKGHKLNKEYEADLVCHS